MDFKVEFNWALKLKPENGLKEEELEAGKTYEFWKSGNRIYPLNIPIDLINQNWEAVAKIIIVEFKNLENRCLGEIQGDKALRRGRKENFNRLLERNRANNQRQKDIGFLEC